TSQTAIAPAVNQTRAEFRQLAQARGRIGWQLLDAQTYSLLQLLYLVEYANTDCQTALGSGRVSAGSARNTGGCDGLNGTSGNGLDATVSYRGLENLWGNTWSFIDGINIIADRQVYIADHDFADNLNSGTYQATGFTLPAADNYCTNWTYSATTVDWLLLPSGVGGSDTTHIPDYFTQATGNTVAMAGGAWDSGTKAGLFSWDVKNPSTHKADNIGTRLMRIPITALQGTITAEDGGAPLEGATISVKSGDTIITTANTAADGTYVIYNLLPGTYTVKFEALGYRTVITADVVIKQDQATNIDKALVEGSMVGASWSVGEPTILTRFADGVDKKEGADFNKFYPWRGIKLCNVTDDGNINATIDDVDHFKWDGTNGQVMVKIPKFYYKRTYTDNKHEFWIADRQFAGFAVHPAFKRGGIEKDHLFVGAYEAGTEGEGADLKLTSVSGIAPAVSRTRDQFRTFAGNRGAKWSQLDILTWSAIQMLYLVEYADTDSQTKIGAGRVNTSSARASGGCNTLNGTSGGVGDAVSYRGIENLWGNVWDFIDGINIQGDRHVYIAESGFADNKFVEPYQFTGFILPSSDNYITDWTYPAAADYAAYDWLMLPSAVGGSASTYIPDCFWQDIGNRVLLVGGGWGEKTNAGLFSSHWSWNRDNSGTNAGARILCIP
ncbi:MAG: carboxypeptidase-like regulatory domain-containing protein, partial [Bacilli bacterium]